MAEFNYRKAKDGKKDKTIIIDKDGSLETLGEYEQISLGHGSYHLGKPHISYKSPKLGKPSIVLKTSVPGRLTESGTIWSTSHVIPKR